MTPRKSLLLALGLATSGCFLNRGESRPPTISAAAIVDNEPAPAIKHWNQLLLQEFKDHSDYQEAWALFSYGGWADAGQIRILQRTGKEAALELAWAHPGQSKWEGSRPLTAAEQSAFRSQAGSFDRVERLDFTAFDALEFEYVHVRRDGEKVVVLRRILMKDPGLIKDRDTGSQQALIGAFQPLLPAKKS